MGYSGQTETRTAEPVQKASVYPLERRVSSCFPSLLASATSPNQGAMSACSRTRTRSARSTVDSADSPAMQVVVNNAQCGKCAECVQPTLSMPATATQGTVASASSFGARVFINGTQAQYSSSTAVHHNPISNPISHKNEEGKEERRTKRREKWGPTHQVITNRRTTTNLPTPPPLRGWMGAHRMRSVKNVRRGLVLK